MASTTSADRDYLNTEYQNLHAEIERIAQNTQWNAAILNVVSNSVAYQVGANGGQTIAVDFAAVDQTNGRLSSAFRRG